MKDAQKPNHASLSVLVSWLREGRFVIPDFQREFEWEPWDIRDLMKSIFLDYYIGSLLLWKGKSENFEALSCESIYGYEGVGDRQQIVLDGQQRLTAMYYAFLAPNVPLPNRANRYFYFIRVDRFMAEQYDEAFEYDWTQRGPALLRDKTKQFAEHVFPLSVVGVGGWELGNWMQEYEQYWRQTSHTAVSQDRQGEADAAVRHADNASVFGRHVREITEQYQIAYIELDQEIAVDKVCDIFTQVNSKGLRLDVFDLINALLTPKGLQLKHMWREAAPRLEFVDTERMNVYSLQVMSILRQAYCSPKYLYFLLPGQEKPLRDPDGTRRKEVLVKSADEFRSYWLAAIDALDDAIKRLRSPQEFGVVSSDYLPYVSILPAFAAIQARVKQIPPMRQLDAQRKVRHWYWASVFTNRYSGSVESTSARDFLDVEAWLDDDESEPPVLAEFRTRFRNLDLRKEVRKGTSVYNGIFNLLVLQGARDWISAMVPQHGELDDHHIVPASWGREQKHSVHTILNRTPLTAETNRKVIRERLPNEYLPELISENGESTVRAILESHFVSPAAQAILLRNPFGVDDFEAFATERQRTLQEAIEVLLIKERLDLSPQLRDLDSRVETIELGLRGLIADKTYRDLGLLPPHIAARIDEKIQRALQKDPALDAEYYRGFDGRMEYCDLRDLQDLITNNSLWSRFEVRFVNKAALNTKFDQVCELRNGIRHSRSVTDIVRKEGEASILWFEQLLVKSD